MLGYPDQVGCEPFCARVVQALCNHAQRIVHRSAIRAAALLATQPAPHFTVHQPDQRLAMQSCHLLHLGQQLAPSFPTRSQVAPTLYL